MDVDEGEGEADEGGIAARGLALAQDDPREVFDPAEQVLDGLITNDKFCLSRSGRLVLSWWRYPLRRRDQEQAHRGTIPDTEGDRGGADAAPVADPPSDAAGCGRSTSMGSGLPADPELEHAGRPARARMPGHLLATTTGGEP